MHKLVSIYLEVSASYFINKSNLVWDTSPRFRGKGKKRKSPKFNVVFKSELKAKFYSVGLFVSKFSLVFRFVICNNFATYRVVTSMH